MKSSFDESSIFSRAKNFRWDTTSLAKRYSEDSNSVLDYEILRDVVIQFCDSGILADSSHPERLEQVFCKIYTILKKEEVICWLFDQHPTFSAHVYEACLFTSLASFLNTSKRIRGMSLTDFVKQNDPLISLKQDLSNYSVLNLVEPEVEKFRKARMRRLAAGDVYIKDTQWSAMTKDSVYEWAVFLLWRLLSQLFVIHTSAWGIYIKESKQQSLQSKMMVITIECKLNTNSFYLNSEK